MLHNKFYTSMKWGEVTDLCMKVFVRNKRVNTYKRAWIEGTVLPELDIIITIITAFQEKQEQHYDLFNNSTLWK